MRSVSNMQEQLEQKESNQQIVPDFFQEFLRDKRFRLEILTQLDREWCREPPQSLVRASDSWSFEQPVPSIGL